MDANPPDSLAVCGRVVDGLGQGQRFTGLDWVRRRFRDLVGLDLHPGTLNLRVEAPGDCERLARLRSAPGIAIDPEPGFCAATAYPVILRRSEGDGRALPAALVVPHVPDYPGDQMELVAAVHLRSALGLRAGDAVTVTVRL